MIKNKKKIILSIGLFALALFLSAAIVSYTPYDIRFETSTPNIYARNYTGIAGAYLLWFFFKIIGYSVFFIPVLCLIWGIGALTERSPRKPVFRVLGSILFFAAVSTFFSSTISSDNVLMVQRGGILGFFLSNLLIGYIGTLGIYIITSTLSILALLIATDFLIIPLITFLFARTWYLLRKLKTIRLSVNRLARAYEKQKPRLRPAVKVDKPKAVKNGYNEGEDKEQDETDDTIGKEESKTILSRIRFSKPKPVVRKPVKIIPRIVGDYKLPTLDLLNSAPPGICNIFSQNMEDSAKVLEDTLQDFGIDAKVVGITKGPVITRYELQPAPGVKVNKITALSDDIALTMKATSVRIVAPIPGKSAVGIEVPNQVSSLVYLRDILESEEYQKAAAKSKLAIALGKDISGRSVVADLGDMPHLLIAGTTGSGKTVCVNSLIMSMIFNAAPDELKFIMVDPKMVELAIYNDLPHLLCPVVTDSKKAKGALDWVVSEMDERYKKLAKVVARNINAFNKKSEEKLPYIVVIIDELADLMMVAQENVENAITRLAQLSRAVGIHIILATQRPSVDVVTGVIKANFPARISFKVASKVDSRTVLDMNGADKLLGKGDMLFLEPGSPKPIRAQGTLLTDEEIGKVVDVIKNQRCPVYDDAILVNQKKSISSRGGGIDKDEFFDEAVNMVFETKQASVSMLQRRLRLGYTRAARLIDAMEEEGIVGPFRGSKPREILVKEYKTDKEVVEKEEQQDEIT